MRLRMMLLAIVWLLLAAELVVAADVHKCRDAQGRVSYSDHPCPDDASTMATRSTDRAPTVAGMRPLCDEVELDWVIDGETLKAMRAQFTMAQKKELALMAWAFAYGRGREPPTRWYHSRRGDVHVCALGKNGKETEYAIGTQGELVRFRSGRGKWLNDPGTPTARLVQCTELITRCAEQAPRTIDRCVAEAPVCGNAVAGACCPNQCKTAYRAQRDAGTSPISALDEVFFGATSCVPGVDHPVQRLEEIQSRRSADGDS